MNSQIELFLEGHGELARGTQKFPDSQQTTVKDFAWLLRVSPIAEMYDEGVKPTSGKTMQSVLPALEAGKFLHN
eukprot:6339692-Amphidinium_carterae.1